MKDLKVALFWFCGVILTFICTVLPILLVLIAKVYGIQPEAMSGLIGTLFFGSLIIALLPALMIALGVADDEMVRFFDESGRQMTMRLNVVAWVVWSGVYFWLSVQLFRRMCPSEKVRGED